jgi:hypothetical protein
MPITKIYTPLFLLLCLLTLSTSSFGQKSEKQLGLGTGWYYHSFSDPTIATSSNTGSSVPILLFFRSNGEKNRHHVQILYAAPTLKSTYLLAREQTGYLQYAYHRKIGIMKNAVHFFGGGVVDANSSYFKYSETGNSYSYSYPFTTIEAITSLSPSLLAEMPLGKDKLDIQIWSAILGYKLGGSKDVRGWVGVGNFWNTGYRVSYRRYFSDHWDARIDYQFQYYTLKKYEIISSLAHQINFCFVYKFH